MKFLLVLILLLLSGCIVTKNEMDWANTVCIGDGGLDYYRNPISLVNNLLGDAHCLNGVVVHGDIWLENDKARTKAAK